MTRDSVDAYTAELTHELRFRDVPGKVIGDAIAQVESHTADSGEDPVDVFDTPREFARQLARGRKRPRGWPLNVTSILLTVGGGLLLVQGAFAQIQDKALFWGVPPVACIAAGTLSVVAWILLMVVTADPIKHPRSLRRGGNVV